MSFCLLDTLPNLKTTMLLWGLVCPIELWEFSFFIHCFFFQGRFGDLKPICIYIKNEKLCQNQVFGVSHTPTHEF